MTNSSLNSVATLLGSCLFAFGGSLNLLLPRHIHSLIISHAKMPTTIPSYGTLNNWVARLLLLLWTKPGKTKYAGVS